MLIKIKNLEINCNIGIHEWEKNFSRQLLINIEIETHNEKSVHSDNIKDTICYEIIYNNIKKIIKEKNRGLIESLANDILLMICDYPQVSRAKVEIDKMKIFDDVYSCAVVLEKKCHRYE